MRVRPIQNVLIQARDTPVSASQVILQWEEHAWVSSDELNT